MKMAAFSPILSSLRADLIAAVAAPTLQTAPNKSHKSQLLHDRTMMAFLWTFCLISKALLRVDPPVAQL